MPNTRSRSSRACATGTRRTTASITDAALVAAATLADRYINDRFLPDKAIDPDRRGGARMRIRRMTAPPDLREFDGEDRRRPPEKESAIDAQDFEKAANLRDKEKQLTAQKAKREREKQWRPATSTSSPRSTTSRSPRSWATGPGIPVFKLTEAGSPACCAWRTSCNKRVIGQEDAIKGAIERPSGAPVPG